MIKNLNIKNIRLDRHEWAGSFGDIGTDLPLILALIPAANLDFASVFFIFGFLQILSGLLYGLPMPMQPLKAMAVIVISQKVAGNIFYGAGLAIGLVMLLLTFTGLLKWLHANIPHHVVRGLQMGLGLSLATLALKNYIPVAGPSGYWIAFACLLIYFFFKDHKKYPASLILIGLGLLISFVVGNEQIATHLEIAFTLPKFNVPTISDISTGFILLALPQLPLSLSNSVIATQKTLGDLYPERKVSVNKIGFTYSLVNLIAPFFSGIPVCHGCGGLAGHYAFGGRTGGSVIIYGSMYVILGLLFAKTGLALFESFPRPILGVILLVEAVVLMKLVKDVAQNSDLFLITLLVAIVAASVPQGFLVALIVGLILSKINSCTSKDRGKL